VRHSSLTTNPPFPYPLPIMQSAFTSSQESALCRGMLATFHRLAADVTIGYVDEVRYAFLPYDFATIRMPIDEPGNSSFVAPGVKGTRTIRPDEINAAVGKSFLQWLGLTADNVLDIVNAGRPYTHLFDAAALVKEANVDHAISMSLQMRSGVPLAFMLHKLLCRDVEQRAQNWLPPVVYNLVVLASQAAYEAARESERGIAVLEAEVTRLHKHNALLEAEVANVTEAMQELAENEAALQIRLQELAERKAEDVDEEEEDVDEEEDEKDTDAPPPAKPTWTGAVLGAARTAVNFVLPAAAAAAAEEEQVDTEKPQLRRSTRVAGKAAAPAPAPAKAPKTKTAAAVGGETVTGTFLNRHGGKYHAQAGCTSIKDRSSYEVVEATVSRGNLCKKCCK